MKVFVGLGNPGKKYENTRHNVGFMVVDRLAGKGEFKESKKGQLMYCWTEWKGEKVEFIKILTFMNNSGEVLAYVKKKHPELRMDDLYIIHDDLDILLGKFKIQKGRGPRDHRGLKSIYERVGKDFWHVRMGIEHRSKKTGQWVEGETYVLQRFSDEEKIIIDEAIEEVVKEIKQIVL